MVTDPTPKAWYSSKLVIFGILTGLVGLANMYGFAEFVPDERSAEIIGRVLAFIGSAVSLIRIYGTSRPIGGLLTGNGPAV